MKILVIEPKKEPYIRDIADDLNEMQEVVGGYIEPIYFDPTNKAIWKANGLPDKSDLQDQPGKLMSIPVKKQFTPPAHNP